MVALLRIIMGPTVLLKMMPQFSCLFPANEQKTSVFIWFIARLVAGMRE